LNAALSSPGKTRLFLNDPMPDSHLHLCGYFSGAPKSKQGRKKRPCCDFAANGTKPRK
jgi:hypothetical protein